MIWAIVLIAAMVLLIVAAVSYLLYRKFYSKLMKKNENGDFKSLPLLGKVFKDRDSVIIL
jgi:hypothetical protein